jgi:hypothetical protein
MVMFHKDSGQASDESPAAQRAGDLATVEVAPEPGLGSTVAAAG